MKRKIFWSEVDSICTGVHQYDTSALLSTGCHVNVAMEMEPRNERGKYAAMKYLC
jgi:hypothetical protein